MASTGNFLSFLFSGNINDLVSLLAGKEIINLIIEEPSLDEIFMHYYK
jgi:ABC-2 type transport system ATP-binding protein